jgi:hypothetical protein
VETHRTKDRKQVRKKRKREEKVVDVSMCLNCGEPVVNRHGVQIKLKPTLQHHRLLGWLGELFNAGSTRRRRRPAHAPEKTTKRKEGGRRRTWTKREDSDGSRGSGIHMQLVRSLGGGIHFSYSSFYYYYYCSPLSNRVIHKVSPSQRGTKVEMDL